MVLGSLLLSLSQFTIGMLSLGIASFFVSPPLSFVSAVNSCTFLHRAFFKGRLVLSRKMKFYWAFLFVWLSVGHFSVTVVMLFVRFPHSALFSNRYASSFGTDVTEGTVSGVNGFIIMLLANHVGSRYVHTPYPYLDRNRYS
jgi:hypothetical protein